MIFQKKQETEKTLKNKLIEQQKMKVLWASQEENHLFLQKQKREAKKKVAKHQLLQAYAKQKTKNIIKKIEETHNKSLVEDLLHKIDEREYNKLQTVKKRINFVHDEERLKKLVRKN